MSLCLGSCEEQKLVPDGLEHRKPKQTKFPGQAYVGLPLCKDSQREDSLEAESREEGPSKGSPVNNVGAPMLKKKTESALCECGALLASMALGLDVRKLHGAQASTKPSLKEGKKGEGTLQPASRCQASTNSLLRQSSAVRAPSDGSTLLLPSATSLFSKSSLSRKCLVQADEEEPPLGSTRISCSHTRLAPDPGSAAPESSCELIPGLRHKTDYGALRNMSPAILEQTGERLPGCATVGDKECHHVQMGSEETPLRPQSRWQQLGQWKGHCRGRKGVDWKAVFLFFFFLVISINNLILFKLHLSVTFLCYKFNITRVSILKRGLIRI